MGEKSLVELFRGRRAAAGHLQRPERPLGDIPTPRIRLERVLVGYFIVCWGLDQLLNKIYHFDFTSQQITFFANVLVFLGTCYPLVIWLFQCIRARRILTEIFFRFPPGAQFWYSICLSQVILRPIFFYVVPSLRQSLGFLGGIGLFFGGGFAVLVLLMWLNERPKKAARARPSGAGNNDRFSLYLGTSTGTLGELGHGASIQRGQNVALTVEDAAQNIMVFGGIGSGKTTRVVQPLLLQLLDQDAGGFIFDIKGDFRHAVSVLAAEVGKEITVIGPERTKMNLVSGLTPEIASSFLKSALLMNSRGTGDPFWVDTATELCKNVLGVLSFIKNRYSLSELHAYLFVPGIRDGVNEEAEAKLPTLSDREARLLKSFLSYHSSIFAAFDEKVRSGVNASVAQILSPFNHPDLVDAFCTDDPEAPPMEKVLEGEVYLVDMPLARWGTGGKVAYNFLKLRFFNVMQRRNVEADWNKTRPVFFMCDEFQEIVSSNRDGLSDLNFWDKSRSSRCIGIVSAQAVSSFYAAIGSHDLADALIQNFRQKICFRTEDSRTIELLNHLLGRVEVVRESHQQGRGESVGGLLKPHTSTSRNESVSRSTIEKNVINPQLFRTMGQNQAVALLSFGGVSADDVIECSPIFIG